jgi:hypothetical protein
MQAVAKPLRMSLAYLPLIVASRCTIAEAQWSELSTGMIVGEAILKKITRAQFKCIFL